MSAKPRFCRIRVYFAKFPNFEKYTVISSIQQKETEGKKRKISLSHPPANAEILRFRLLLRP